MYPNLKAEMARNNINTKDLAECLEVSRKSVNNKMAGRTPFMLDEAKKIRDKLFPSIDIDILFNKEIVFSSKELN